jgi:putative aldouronate transport system permease protein
MSQAPITTAISNKTISDSSPRRGYKESTGVRVFQVFNTIIMTVISGLTVYPFLYLVAQSFSSEAAIMKGLVNIFPVGFNLTTYISVLHKGDFQRYYVNTIYYTLVGTIFSVLLSSMLAYPMSKTFFKANKFIGPS